MLKTKNIIRLTHLPLAPENLIQYDLSESNILVMKVTNIIQSFIQR